MYVEHLKVQGRISPLQNFIPLWALCLSPRQREPNEVRTRHALGRARQRRKWRYRGRGLEDRSRPLSKISSLCPRSHAGQVVSKTKDTGHEQLAFRNEPEITANRSDRYNMRTRSIRTVRSAQRENERQSVRTSRKKRLQHPVGGDV